MALFLFGFGLYGYGVYLAELQRQNGWPAVLISGASTLSFLLANISRPSPTSSWPGWARSGLFCREWRRWRRP
jgi:hypothetical protein